MSDQRTCSVMVNRSLISTIMPSDGTVDSKPRPMTCHLTAGSAGRGTSIGFVGFDAKDFVKRGGLGFRRRLQGHFDDAHRRDASALADSDFVADADFAGALG